MGAREDALARLAAMGGNDTGTTVPDVYAQLTDAQMIGQPRVGPRRQGTLEDLAAARAAQAEPTGLGGMMYDINKNIVGKTALKALMAVDLPRSLMVSAVNEGADLLGEVASGLGFDRWDDVKVTQYGENMPDADKFKGWSEEEINAYKMANSQLGNRDASLGDLFGQAADHVGFGDVIENTSPNAPQWAKVVGGIAGDIALDPLTYIAATGKAALKIGGEGAEAAAEAGLKEAYKQGTRNGLSDALAQVAEKQGLAANDAIQRLVKGVANQGRGGLTDAAIKAAGVTADDLGKLGIEGIGRQFGSKVFTGKAAKGWTSAMESAKGYAKAKIGGSFVGRYGRALRYTNKAMQKNLTDIMRNLDTPAQEVFQAALASGVAKNARVGAARWGTDWLHAASKRFKGVEGFNKYGKDARINITHSIEDEIAGDNAVDTVVDLIHDIGFGPNGMTSKGVQVQDTFGRKYVPHITTREARRLSGSNNDFAIFMSGLDDQAWFMRKRADTRTIREINEESMARFGVKALEDDITDILGIFMASAEKQVERQSVQDGLRGAGLMLDNEFERSLSPVQEALRLELVEAKKVAYDQADVHLRNGLRLRADSLNTAVSKVRTLRAKSMRELAKAKKVLADAEQKAAVIGRRVDTLTNHTIPALEQEIVRLEGIVAAAKGSQKRSLAAKLSRAKTTLKQAEDELKNVMTKHAKTVDVVKVQKRVDDAVAKLEAAKVEALTLFPDAAAKPQVVAPEPSAAHVAPEPPVAAATPTPTAAPSIATEAQRQIDDLAAQIGAANTKAADVRKKLDDLYRVSSAGKPADMADDEWSRVLAANMEQQRALGTELDKTLKNVKKLSKSRDDVVMRARAAAAPAPAEAPKPTVVRMGEGELDKLFEKYPEIRTISSDLLGGAGATAEGRRAVLDQYIARQRQLYESRMVGELMPTRKGVSESQLAIQKDELKKRLIMFDDRSKRWADQVLRDVNDVRPIGGAAPAPAAAAAVPEPTVAPVVDDAVIAERDALVARIEQIKTDHAAARDAWKSERDTIIADRDAVRGQFMDENAAAAAKPQRAADDPLSSAERDEYEQLIVQIDEAQRAYDNAMNDGVLDDIERLHSNVEYLNNRMDWLQSKIDYAESQAVAASSKTMPEFRSADEARAWAASQADSLRAEADDARKVVDGIKEQIAETRKRLNTPDSKIPRAMREADAKAKRKLIVDLEAQLEPATKKMLAAENKWRKKVIQLEEKAVASMTVDPAIAAQGRAARAKFAPKTKKASLTPEQEAHLAKYDDAIKAGDAKEAERVAAAKAEIVEATAALKKAEKAVQKASKPQPAPKAAQAAPVVAPEPTVAPVAAPKPVVEPPSVQMVVDPAEQAAVEQARAKFIKAHEAAVIRAQKALEQANNSNVFAQQEIANAMAAVSNAELKLASHQADMDKLASLGVKEYLTVDDQKYLKWLNTNADTAKKNLQKDVTLLGNEQTLIADSTQLQSVLESLIDDFNRLGAGFKNGTRGNQYVQSDRAIMSQHIDEMVSRINQLSDPALQAEFGPVATLLAQSERQALIWDIMQGGALQTAKDIEDVLHLMSKPEFAEVITYAAKAPDGWTLVGEKYKVPNWLNDAMSAQIELHKPDVWSDFTDAMRKTQNVWKAMATSRPGFVLRNILSSAFSMYLEAGAVAFKNMKRMAEFLELRNKFPEDYLVRAADKGMTNVAAMDAAFSAVAGSGSGQVVSEFVTEVGKGVNFKPWSADFGVYRGIRSVNEKAESLIRATHAYTVIERGGTAVQATDVLNKWHFNYRDLSKTDRRMKDFVPFWSFFSNNVALQAHIFTHELPKLNRTVMNIKRNTEHNQNNSMLPDYMGGQFLFGGNPDAAGTQRFYDAGLPSMQFLSDAATMQNNPLALIGGMASPLVALPAQALFNRDTLTGRGWDSPSDFATNKMLPSMIPFVGHYNRVTDPQKFDEALIGLLTGAGVREIDAQDKYWAQKQAYEEMLSDARRKARGG